MFPRAYVNPLSEFYDLFGFAQCVKIVHFFRNFRMSSKSVLPFISCRDRFDTELFLRRVDIHRSHSLLE